MLSEIQIEKFQQLYRNRFGTDIDRDRAIELGTRLVEMMRVVYRPIKAGGIELLTKT